MRFITTKEPSWWPHEYGQYTNQDFGGDCQPEGGFTLGTSLAVYRSGQQGIYFPFGKTEQQVPFTFQHEVGMKMHSMESLAMVDAIQLQPSDFDWAVNYLFYQEYYQKIEQSSYMTSFFQPKSSTEAEDGLIFDEEGERCYERNGDNKSGWLHSFDNWDEGRTWFTVRVEVEATTRRVYVDGVLRQECFNDEPIESTMLGVFGYVDQPAVGLESRNCSGGYDPSFKNTPPHQYTSMKDAKDWGENEVGDNCIPLTEAEKASLRQNLILNPMPGIEKDEVWAMYKTGSEKGDKSKKRGRPSRRGRKLFLAELEALAETEIGAQAEAEIDAEKKGKDKKSKSKERKSKKDKSKKSKKDKSKKSKKSKSKSKKSKSESVDEYYLLNVQRAKQCRNAYLSVAGDCSAPGELKWSEYYDAVPFMFKGWPINYNFDADVLANESISWSAGGMLQNYVEVGGRCEVGENRWVSQALFDDGSLGSVTTKEDSHQHPFFDFCWLKSMCLNYDAGYDPTTSRLQGE